MPPAASPLSRLRSRFRERPDVISDLAKQYKNDEILIGAGTVLDPETARIAILSGAQFVVSPALNPEAARLCNRYQIPYMPGAATPREVIEAMECGADIVKVFPGDTLGPSFVKAIRGPLPQASLMPTGGVDIGNVADWIKAGCVAVGVGGNLTASAKIGRLQNHHQSCETVHREDPQRTGMTTTMDKKIVTFGEIMLRLASPGAERFLQSPRFDATFGGGEANVAIALASFGLSAVYVTALPEKNPIADAAIAELRGLGVDTSQHRSGERPHGHLLSGSRRESAAVARGLRSREQCDRTGETWRHRLEEIV